MIALQHATIIWVGGQGSNQVVRAPSWKGDQDESVSPPPSLYPIASVNYEEALADEWQRALESLNQEDPYMAVNLRSPDGPPSKVILIYEPIGHTTKLVKKRPATPAGKTPEIGQDLQRVEGITYRAIGPTETSNRGTDPQKHGYFLIGGAHRTNLWRVARVEIDHLKRYQFTIIPVVLPYGLGTPKFRVVSEAVREALRERWQEMENAYHNHRSVALVTATKNVGEILLSWRLAGTFNGKPPDMARLLRTLKSVLRSRSRDTYGFSTLDYYLLSKIYFLHEGIETQGSSDVGLTPELAVSTIQDIAAVLRSLGVLA